MEKQEIILRILKEKTCNDVNEAGDNILAVDHDLHSLSQEITEALDDRKPLEDLCRYIFRFHNSLNENDVNRVVTNFLESK